MSRISLGCAAVLALSAVACDSVPLVAPTDSTLTIMVASSFVPTGGTTEVTAYVVESAGTPVQNGTTVRFSTNLGRMEPAEAQTRNGYAVTTFFAGDSSGLADIRAFSGGAVSGSGDDANGATQITVGAAAVETVVLAANPGSVPSSGGTVDLLATVTAANGRSLPGILVTFASSEGSLGNPTVVTDANGQARTTLTTTRTATVTASAGSITSSTVTVTRRDPASVATATVSATTIAAPVVGVGQSVTFTANVTVAPPDSAIQPIRYEWAFGDGTSTVTNGNVTSHTYTSGANSPRIVTVKIDLTNGQTLVATTEILLGTF